MARALSGSLLLLAACGGDVDAGASPRPASVLLVAIDGLRVDQVGAYQGGSGVTPNLDQLAREGLRYSDVATPAPWTAPAVAALLTGRYPTALGWTGLDVPLPYEATLLGERLGEEGYATGAVVNSRHVAARFNLDQGFDAYDEVGLVPVEATDDDAFPPTAAQVTDAALRLVDGAGARPFGLLVHYADALPPWDVPGAAIDPSYLGPIERGLSLRELLRLGPSLGGADLAALVALHDAAVAHVDHELGRLLRGLDERGRRVDTFVAVVATSGLELADHGELGNAKRLYDELVHVPWVLAGPNLEPDVLEDAASLIDVAPTLLELLGTRPLDRADGAPVLPHLAPPARLLVSETDRARSLRAVTIDRWKLIHDKERGTSELYDLLEDPGETRDLARQQPEQVEQLIEYLEAWEESCAAE